MAVVAVTTKMVACVKYTHTTANSSDWASVSNNTYFYDIAKEIVYYKDTNGVVQSNYRELPSVQSVVSSASNGESFYVIRFDEYSQVLGEPLEILVD